MRGKTLGLVLAVIIVVGLIQASAVFACLVQVGPICVLAKPGVGEGVNFGISPNPRCGGSIGPGNVGPGTR